MIERFRDLSIPSRYLVYAIGLLLVLSVAVGMGAAVAFVVGRQSGAATTGSAKSGPVEGRSTETGTSGAGKSETNDTNQASEGTRTEPSGKSESPGKGSGVSFVHRATDKNSRGDYTVISNPNIDGQPNTIVLVSLAPTQSDSGAAAYHHNIGVWYAARAGRWAIFNQDLAPVPAGTTFEVEVPPASTKFVHEADLLNTAGNYTYLDDRLTNGKPDAALSVTQNWNPGGGRGVYNDHPVGIAYDTKVEKWAVFNEDGKSMPEGAAFNVAVSEGGTAR
jgi:hypothetical protein